MVVKYNPDSVVDILFRRRGTVFFQPAVLFGIVWGGFWGSAVVVAYRSGWRTSFSGVDVADTDDGNFLDTTLHTQIAFVVALLLSFKANLAWNRYWLAILTIRDMQTSMVSGVSAAVALIDPSHHRDRLIHYFKAAFHLSLEVLRPGGRSPLASSIRTELSDREHMLLSSMLPRHRPAYAITKGLSKIAAVERLGLGRMALANSLPAALTAINKDFTVAYELKTNPPPLPYVHTLYVIILFLTATLPLTIGVTQGWATPFTTALITYALLAVDAISRLLEDPFGDDAVDIDLVAFERSAFEQVDRIVEASAIIDSDLARVKAERDAAASAPSPPPLPPPADDDDLADADDRFASFVARSTNRPADPGSPGTGTGLFPTVSASPFA